MNYLLMNPLADNGAGEISGQKALEELKGRFVGLKLINVLELDPEEFLAKLKKEDNVILLGGDGTLNHAINDLKGRMPTCNFYLHQAGTGNDFLRDVADEIKDGLLLLNPHIKKLPHVEVKGKTYYFINGIGFGIDGEACRVADDMKAAGKKKIDYAAISVKLLLFKFKRPTATVKIDGKELVFKKACLASAMNGRYYGGGMDIAPDQKRDGDLLSFVTMHGSTRLGTLMVFPKIFKGTHVAYTKQVYIQTGKKIEVSFDHPCSLQVDGETIRDVTSYVAYAAE